MITLLLFLHIILQKSCSAKSGEMPSFDFANSRQNFHGIRILSSQKFTVGDELGALRRLTVEEKSSASATGLEKQEKYRKMSSILIYIIRYVI